MKKTSLFFIAIVISLGIIAQTKRIANRSHSGKDNIYVMDGGNNFGLPPSTKKTTDSTKTIKTKLDSIPAKPALAKTKKKKVKTVSK